MLLVKIIRLLDGTPAVYGKRQSGQSVVELALITPILIVLLAGLIEIGWFANNYLTLLDVTRAGARRGAVLQDQQSPLFWDDSYSYLPHSLLPDSDFWMPYTATDFDPLPAPGEYNDEHRFVYRWYPDVASPPAGSQGQEPCDTNYTPRVFYNEILCTMIVSMEPLELNPENGIDDIVVSGFGMQRVRAQFLDPTTRPIADDVAQTVVAARYP
ncbi:MAG: pilus assembly protein, partial [Anaerolineae bacterium]|nr:pilus assembly protein [Anaerolineae bacterium]